MKKIYTVYCFVSLCGCTIVRININTSLWSPSPSYVCIYQQEAFNSSMRGQQVFGQTTLFLSVISAQHWPALVTQFTGPRHIICEAIPGKFRRNWKCILTLSLPIPRRPRPPPASGGSREIADVPTVEAANIRAAPLLTIGNTTEIENVQGVPEKTLVCV